MSHLDEDRLFGFVLGKLPDSEALNAEAHLEACAECRTRRESLSSLVFASTLTTPSPSAPTGKEGPPTRPDAPEAKAAQASPTDRGTPLGRYLLLERLGAGGMGEVFAAYDPQLDRRVALKLLRAGALSAAEGSARLVREAQAMARLQHPNVAAVHDVGTFGEHVFVAMEFVDGETLGEWLRGDRPWLEALRMFLQAGAGLAAAHHAGLVHRDFKPDNVLIGTDGRPRVVDFGLARQSTSSPPGALRPGELPDGVADSPLNTRLTRDGAVMGTPGYMAPEQLAGLPTDARCDQFAFCVALYEALYGKRPFGGATLKQHAQEISSGRLPDPPASSPVPSWVFEVVKRGLSPNPADRYENMEALLVALEPRTRARSRKVVIATLALAALVAGWALFTQQRLRVCSGYDQRLVGVWDPPSRSRLRDAMLATGLPFAPEVWKSAEKALDAYTQDWLNASREVCEAARIRKVDAEEVFEFKTMCLEGRMQRLAALTRLIAAADRDIAANAATAARSLDPVIGCFDVTGMARMAVVSEKDRAADTALEAAIVEARALFDAGKYAPGAELLRKALALGGPPRTRADAALWLGRLHLRAGDARSAGEDFLQAVEFALAAGDPALEALAFSRLFGNVGYDREDKDAAAWGRLARAAAERTGGDWEVQAELSTNEALVSLSKRQFKEALVAFQIALQLQEEHLGPEHPVVAMTLNNLGVTSTNLGDFQAAIVRYERSLALHQALEGPEHPNSASAENNLGHVLRRLGRYSDAAARYQHALTVRRKALGPEHPETLKTAEALAMVSINTGQHELALDLLTENLATHQRLAGEESKEVAQTYGALAELYARGSYWKEAQHHAELALAIGRKSSGDRSLAAAGALLALGGILGHQGSWTESRKDLDEALSIRIERLGADSNDVAGVLNAQADLAMEQRHAPEALALYERARDLRVRAGTATPESRLSDLLGIGRCLVQLDRAGEGIEPLRQGLELSKGVEDSETLAAVSFELGRALWLAGQATRPEALPLLRNSKTRLGVEQQRAADAWLAKVDLKLAPPDSGTP